jgi:hypothetical protein
LLFGVMAVQLNFASRIVRRLPSAATN